MTDEFTIPEESPPPETVGESAPAPSFIISHINEYDTVFYTRVAAESEDSAREKLLAAHTDNIIIEVLPPDRTNPPRTRSGGSPTVVDLTLEP